MLALVAMVLPMAITSADSNANVIADIQLPVV